MTRAALFNPVELVEGDRTRAMMLVADHARNALPDDYGDLGLPATEFTRHIAYDIGVEALTRALAERLDVPAIMATWSRLLIDPNRGEDDPTLIRQLYDGTVIPANYPMSGAERESRLDRFYRPYHDAVSAMASSLAAGKNGTPFIVSIHSFTPTMQGRARPWQIGILWDSDPRAVEPMLEALRADPELTVGDNEPYDGALRGDTMFRHAIVNGYAHLLIEIRQDLIADERGVAEWADRLAPILAGINARPEIHVARQFGSRTGPV